MVLDAFGINGQHSDAGRGVHVWVACAALGPGRGDGAQGKGGGRKGGWTLAERKTASYLSSMHHVSSSTRTGRPQDNRGGRGATGTSFSLDLAVGVWNERGRLSFGFCDGTWF